MDITSPGSIFTSKTDKDKNNSMDDDDDKGMDKDMEEYYDLFKKRWFIVPKDSFFKTFWNNLIIVLAIYNSFSTPLIIAFTEVDEYWQSNAEIVFAE